MNSAQLYFGPAGWSYADWQGTVYPQPQPPRFNALGFIAERFDFVEVNSSFYRTPSLQLTTGWVRKTSHLPLFSFWIKIHQNFTHQRTLERQEISAFRESLQPLADAGKLQGLLAQFPYSFKYSTENLDYLHRLAGLLGPPPLAVEFRHRSWDCVEVLEFFRASKLIFTNIDQPAVSLSLPLTAHASHPETAYVRLHGRNAANWFADAGRDARYDYLYSLSELGQIAEVIKKLQEQVKKIFVSGNNHYKGSAVRNLMQLKEILQGH